MLLLSRTLTLVCRLFLRTRSPVTSQMLSRTRTEKSASTADSPRVSNPLNDLAVLFSELLSPIGNVFSWFPNKKGEAPEPSTLLSPFIRWTFDPRTATKLPEPVTITEFLGECVPSPLFFSRSWWSTDQPGGQFLAATIATPESATSIRTSRSGTSPSPSTP